MESCGIGKTRPRRPVRAIPPKRTRVPGQKVCIYRSDCWIALKCFHEFLEVVFDGVAWNRYNTSMASEQGQFTN